MADKAWKAHERNVAEFFGTRRALHGMDRDLGEVTTDVFVDYKKWAASKDEDFSAYSSIGYEQANGLALVIECKYEDKDSKGNNSWPVIELNKISKESGAKGSSPLIMTRDRWKWVQIDDFEKYLELMYFSPDSMDIVYNFEVRHLNRKMSKFFDNAIEEARRVRIPRRDQNVSEDPFAFVLHVVCVGTNTRMPKAIGIPPVGIISLEE